VLTFLISLPFWGEIHFSPENVAAMAYLGVVQLGIAYVLYSRAICHVRALDAILITTLEPILNPIWVFLVLGEAPGFYSLIGGAIVISAILIRGWLTQRETLK
jgi:drug/metabolite transporter (DMT)-like permease